MPQPRKYKTRSEQQAAYRLRVKRSQLELLSSKALPPLPALPVIPGTIRWKAMNKQVDLLLSMAADEMLNYYEDRSEQWQESEKAEEFLAKQERLREIIDLLQDID